MKKSSKINNNSKSSKSVKKNPENNGVFCTECGSELDDFALSRKSKNKKSIIDNHHNCVRTGKFSGEFCSKIFISDDNLFGDFLNEKTN